jgi:olefin beta-lactone synthetase
MTALGISTTAPPGSTDGRLNVADRLAAQAAARPDAVAIACPRRISPQHRLLRRGAAPAEYATITFAELDADAARIANGLAAWGVPKGARLALLVRPGIEFVTLVFGLLRAGVVTALIDPGMGRRHLIRCLAETEPDGFVGVPAAQAVRTLLRHKFPRAQWNVTIGRRWGWSGVTLDQLRIATSNPHSEIRNPKLTSPDDPAAIIFTSGSTGPAKGVLYTHRMFDTQLSEIQSTYGIEAGGVDLSCFPLFALFNSAMGVTTVLPKMDFSRPAAADPRKLLAAANDWQVTQAFASPAVWRNVSAHCEQTGQRFASLRQIFSCGAPVPAAALRTTLACAAPDAKMHTPYGATECLPVATIEAEEVLRETAAKTDEGAGICVGRSFDSIDWRVIRISDGPLASINDTEELPTGEIGELIVRGPQASPMYVTRMECNAESKIPALAGQYASAATEYKVLSTKDEGSPRRPHSESSAPRLQPSASMWHRMGDVGYLDEHGRFWYCGRKSQRVETTAGTLFTECVESIFNNHPAVRRSALVGVGLRGRQIPAVIVERAQANPRLRDELLQLARAHKTTRGIDQIFVVQWRLPVDVRHNAKINREKLTVWAAKRLSELR